MDDTWPVILIVPRCKFILVTERKLIIQIEDIVLILIGHYHDVSMLLFYAGRAKHVIGPRQVSVDSHIIGAVHASIEFILLILLSVRYSVDVLSRPRGF